MNDKKRERRRHERGEYRPIFVAWLNGKDFQVLGADARWLLVNVKLLMGPLGIGPHPGADRLSDTTGLKRPRVLKALRQLEGTAWIETEGTVLWLVRGLEFEPQFDPKNKNHRPFIADRIAELPRSPIIDRFKARYHAFFSDSPTHSHTDSHPPSHTHSQGGSEPAASSLLPPTTNQILPLAPAREGYVLRLTKALNGALEVKLAGAYRPIVAAVEAQREDVQALERDGIPVEMAERVIRSKVESFRITAHDRQPSTLGYFVKAIREAHAKDTATPPPRELSVAERLRQMADEERRKEDAA